MQKIILASHDDLSQGMLHSVKMIVGDLANAITTYSLYPGCNPQDYVTELAVEITENQDIQYLIITDIEGGSVNNACIQLARFANVSVIAGMNLCLIIEVLLCGEEVIHAQKAMDLVERAKTGIVYYGEFHIEGIAKDEF